ncbi:MAG: efflux RND transporter periplasmic adaptor subunit [Bacteroidia bacterium]|nr:efflux RND transporter periplasmic adaptor subunit [Bacteroidia bacterium]
MKKYSFLLLTFLIFSCQTKEESTENTLQPAAENTVQLNPEQLRRAGIRTGPIENRSMSSRLQVNGIIDVPPQNMIAITFPPGGYLKSTRLLPGMHIRKGQELAIMEDPKLIQLQQDYLTALIRGRQLEQEFLRQQDLNRNKASSDKIFQEAESAYKTGKVLIRSLSEQLQLAGIDPVNLNENTISRSVAIRSGIDGYVASVKVNIGAYIQPGDILFELVDPEDIHLNMTVFEKDIQQLSIGQKVKTWTNTHPEKKYPCEIILIGKELDEHRSVEVHCHFERYDKTLLPGMFMNAEIDVQQRTVPVVPEKALVNFQDKSYLFADDGGGKFTMLQVLTGIKESGFVEVMAVDARRELPQTIVLDNAYTLLMQLKNKAEE